MRSKPAPKRPLPPDPKFGNTTITKLVHFVMRRGKKTVAQKIVYAALARVETEAKRNPVEVFEQALKNVQPVVEVKARRVGGANYQIPIEVRGERRLQLGLRWIIGAAAAKRGRPMHLKLADEILLAAQNQGDAVKKKEDVHRMAEANRAFAHYA